MNKIVDFYESNHLLLLIVIIFIFIIYVNLNRKTKYKIKVTLDDEKQNINQVSNVVNELETQNHIMEPQTFEYTSTRLTFRRDVIELMDFNDLLIINVLGAQNTENEGTFIMTKMQIYQTFDNVINSVAYIRDGNYNYQTTPQRAQRFRVL